MKNERILQNLWFLQNTNYKWYTIGSFREGINRVFRYTKNLKTNSFDEVAMYIYCHNGGLVANTFSPRIDSCKFRFDEIVKAKGDISKVGFECKYKLEIF